MGALSGARTPVSSMTDFRSIHELLTSPARTGKARPPKQYVVIPPAPRLQEASCANDPGCTLLIPLLAAAFVLAGQLPAVASHAGSDAAISPLAICRDGIRFMFFAD